MEELTKQVVQAKKNELEAKIDNNDAEIESLEAICRLKVSESVVLRAQLQALKADIPEPTPDLEE